MIVKGKKTQTIWISNDGWSINIIDQTLLPFRFEIKNLKSYKDAIYAIKNMQVRGAPLIGVTSAFGMCLAAKENSNINFLQNAKKELSDSRPTAVNLRWALDRMINLIIKSPKEKLVEIMYNEASLILEEDINFCKKIGEHGLKLIENISKEKNDVVNILTHCNAGWLAAVDWGTATSPIYHAFNKNIPIHVWVDETRPRNQGSFLTAWELGEHGVPYTVIVDNAGGHIIQKGKVDIVIVGSDRTTVSGDVCNKIGTYLKALAAKANNVPFYAALPSSSIDWKIENGLKEIPIEKRDSNEVLYIKGKTSAGNLENIQLMPDGSNVENYAFDVTPRNLVTGIITERGICSANKKEILTLFYEKADFKKNK